MRAALTVVVVLLLTGCASFDGRGLVPRQSTAADVEKVMGRPADKREVGNETWLYFPRQPFGRKTFVARLAADGRLVALEQRLTDENVAKIIPNTTRSEQVRDLLGPPWSVSRYPLNNQTVWTWHMRHFGDPGVPVELDVQMSADGVVRQVYLIDESDSVDSVAMAGR
jgi:outer membrane protein assembly factor BamE (lipoprotein component of BamABCDE complex)